MRRFKCVLFLTALLGFVSGVRAAENPAAPAPGTTTASATFAAVIAPPESVVSSAADIADTITAALDDPRVTVTVLKTAQNEFIAVLTGTVQPTSTGSPELGKNGIGARAGQFTPDVVARVVNNLEEDAEAKTRQEARQAEEQAAAEQAAREKKLADVKTEIWPLTFVTSRLGDSEEPFQYDVNSLILALNGIYGTDPKNPPVHLARNTLVITGNSTTRLDIKRQLALLDAPGPQVQLDLWAIQFSGKRGPEFSQQLETIARRVGATQGQLRMVPYLMNEVISYSIYDQHFVLSQGLITNLDKVGFDTSRRRPLNLTEMLIFLALADSSGRRNILKKVEERVQIETSQSSFRLSNLRKVLSVDTSGSLLNVELDQKGIKGFVDALAAFNVNDGKGSAIALRRHAATADNLLKAGMDAFTADMQEQFLDPLVCDLTKEQQGGIKGVSLVGRSRLVVTSGLESSLKPDLSSFVETTRPAPLGTEILDQAFPAGKNADAEKASSLTGAASILAGLNPAQAIALAAALNPPTPTFTEVAPGIGINVRPAVLPDGGSARLQVKMKFGVETKDFNGGEPKNVLTWPPADAVKSHRVATDAIVNAFDLFNISSFGISTSYPRPPGYIPVLGTLPIIGKAFQWRRKDTQLEHHSLILVNTVILPRVLDLARFFGTDDSNTPPSTPSGP